MASLSTCHLGLWLGWQILLNLSPSHCLCSPRSHHTLPSPKPTALTHRPASVDISPSCTPYTHHLLVPLSTSSSCTSLYIIFLYLSLHHLLVPLSTSSSCTSLYIIFLYLSLHHLLVPLSTSSSLFLCPRIYNKIYPAVTARTCQITLRLQMYVDD